MPVQACLMTAIHPSGLLACQACLIEFSSGVRLPDRQVSPAIHNEACMTGMPVYVCLSGMPDSVWPALRKVLELLEELHIAYPFI